MIRSSLGLLGCWLLLAPAFAADLPAAPVRVANERLGHSHPAICVTRQGTIVIAHYNEGGGKVFVCRSTDGGKSWSEAEVPDIGGCHPYPGALTTLNDGRVLLTWNGWVDWNDKAKGRRPWFCTSRDDGKTWGPPKPLDLEAAGGCYVRHSIVELAADRWLFPLGDRTIVYDAARGQSAPFSEERKLIGIPMTRTAKGTLLAGNGLRSTDQGKTWQQVKPFPAVSNDNWRHDLVALSNGWVVAALSTDERLRLTASLDDGLTWGLDHALVFYDPGRRLGRGTPHLAELDKDTLGVVFKDSDREQPGGPAILFMRIPLDRFRR